MRYAYSNSYRQTRSLGYTGTTMPSYHSASLLFSLQSLNLTVLGTVTHDGCYILYESQSTSNALSRMFLDFSLVPLILTNLHLGP
jgi:hypothetical protein